VIIKRPFRGGNFMEIYRLFICMALGGFILYIIYGVIKKAVRDALFEFKEEIIIEINQRKANEDKKVIN
jgi:hypothetical protein